MPTSKLFTKAAWNRYKLHHRHITILFINVQIFIQLDELNELDTITQAWIGFNYSLTQAQKHSSFMVTVADN